MTSDCTRHAFTDGDCVKAGCRNCPARLGEIATSSTDDGSAIAAVILIAGLAGLVGLIVRGIFHVLD